MALEQVRELSVAAAVLEGLSAAFPALPAAEQGALLADLDSTALECLLHAQVAAGNAGAVRLPPAPAAGTAEERREYSLTSLLARSRRS